MAKFEVVGNNIGAMICALELANKGNQVRLINPLPFWGSHLVGTKVDGHKFDFGRIIYDFFSYNNDKTSDIKTYDAHVRNDVGRFYTHIREYIESHIEVNEMSTPQMYFNGKFTEDFLFADSLNVLSELDEQTKAKVKGELIAIVAGDRTLHASNKRNPSVAFMRTNFALVSIANHGKTLHEALIAPYLNKVLESDNPELCPQYHRIPWVPLYYPETLLTYFTDLPQELPKPKFHYPTTGYFAIIIEKLEQAIKEHNNIEIIYDKVESIEVEGASNFAVKLKNQAFYSNNLVWAGDQEQLAQALKTDSPEEETQKLPITFTFVRLKSEEVKKKFSVLVVVDADQVPYRITNQTNCSGIEDDYTKLAVECNPTQLATAAGESEDDQKALIIKSLVAMRIIATPNVVDAISIKRVDKTIRIPNRKNEESFNHYYKSLSSHKGNILQLGTSADFVAISINDQILQGLLIAEKYG